MGLRDAAAQLSDDGGARAAEAIMTTDTRPKSVCAQREGFAVGGMAKGAGMIHPLLATMLVVLTTDYPLSAEEADSFLRAAVDRSFNRISVDGDTSTNDTVILLANGASGAQRTPDLDGCFRDVLQEVCDKLARQLVEDGEGVSVVLEIAVNGAADDQQATRDREPDRDVAARQDRRIRPRSELGPRPDGGGLGALERRACGARSRSAFSSPSTGRRSWPAAIRPAPRRTQAARSAGSSSTSASAPVPRPTWRRDLSYDYVRINAEYTT